MASKNLAPTERIGHVGIDGKKGMRGQNAKYTNVTLLSRVALQILRGNSKTDSFRKVGVNPDTGFQWLAWGKQDPPHHPILRKFYMVVERAHAHYNSRMVGLVTDAASSGAPNTWQAAMTMLERRDPANWGKKVISNVKIEADQPLVQLNQVVLADTDARDSLRSVLRRVAGPGTHEPLGLGVGDEPEEDAGELTGESE